MYCLLLPLFREAPRTQHVSVAVTPENASTVPPTAAVHDKVNQAFGNEVCLFNGQRVVVDRVNPVLQHMDIVGVLVIPV